MEGKVDISDWVEYKTGWNPNDIIHSICAFANDYDNSNGGYIVIGVKEEKGMPVFPLAGVQKEELDSIQQEIFRYCNMIVPRYIPRMEIVNYKNSETYLIYLWCPAGDSGPYQAPQSVYSVKGGKIDKSMKYWIRPASLTTDAKQDEISELYDKFNSVPFDDRINRKARIDDIRRGYIEDFIRKSNSSLINELNNCTLEDLLIAQEVADETDTELDIRNIGVLMFTEHPEKLIPGAYIELIRFNTKDAEASDDFIEKTFTGPIWKQVIDALDYIKNTVIEQKVEKIQGQAEAVRFYNYPYNALEEALVNAIFHKSYREAEPVEIRIYVDSIQILNYPGLDKWIDLERFKEGKIRGRKYRNRRIGEFFKEIDLSEKKGTGIPKILRELKKNGSLAPEFDMDDDRTYLNTIIHIRDGFEMSGSMSELMSELMSESMSELMTKLEIEVNDKSLSELEQKRIQQIYAYLMKYKEINSARAAELLDVQIKTASRLLKKAEELNLINSSGKTRDKVYFIK